MVRGIRGAVTVKENSRRAIFAATQKLLRAMVRDNHVTRDDIASVFLTATEDLNVEFPAYALRQMGWKTVPILCAREMGVPGSMRKVIRALIHVNMDKAQPEIKHQYLGGAKKLRPDLFRRSGRK